MDEIRRILTGFKLQELFIEHLNWSHVNGKPAPLIVGENCFTFEHVAQLRGLVVVRVLPASGNPIPPLDIRSAVAVAFRKQHHEFIHIWGEGTTDQIWHTLVSGKRGKGRHAEVKQATQLESLCESLHVSLEQAQSVELATIVGIRDKAFERLQRDYLKGLYTNHFFETVGQHSTLADLPRNSSCWYGDTSDFRVVSTYSNNGRGYFWFGFHEKWDKFLSGGGQGFLVLVCADTMVAYAIPFAELKSRLGYLNRSRGWHHLRVETIDGKMSVDLPKLNDGESWNIEPFMLDVHTSERDF